ncbi:hypothetical protein DPMN_182229 [Dreissena polymorpha]|uniref:Uncharacterized protein n=1 Tax=Dreissena polymorpha TaxID=45954 RepID=A0A9D4DDS5_DREPO|nr:hypothetical protein DPMN_182229 [Dreissena polymorpha]
MKPLANSLQDIDISIPSQSPVFPGGQKNVAINLLTKFGLTETIFELNSCIKETNVLTKFHENWAKNVTSRKNAPPTGGHVFSLIQTIVKLVQVINKSNVLTNFHDDWAKIVTSRPNRENCHYKHIEKNAPPTGGHVFSLIWTIFELVRDIN